MTRNANQLQNHPKFITVHGTWAGGSPHTIPEQGTMGGGYCYQLLIDSGRAYGPLSNKL